MVSRSTLSQLFNANMFLSFKLAQNATVNSRQQFKTFFMHIANNEITRNVNSQLCENYVKRNTGIVLCIFHEIKCF